MPWLMLYSNGQHCSLDVQMPCQMWACLEWCYLLLTNIASQIHTSLGGWGLVLLRRCGLVDSHMQLIMWSRLEWCCMPLPDVAFKICRNNIKCVNTLFNSIYCWPASPEQWMQYTINDTHSMCTCHFWCIQTMDDVINYWSMLSWWCMQAMNDVVESMRTIRDLCMQDFVDISSLRATSLARQTHSTFVCVGLRGCCLPLADIYRLICTNNARCWQATFDVGWLMSAVYGGCGLTMFDVNNQCV